MTHQGSESRWRRGARWGLAALFVGAGAMHFVNPEPYVRLIPPYLPAPLLLVYVSGVAEVLGGLGVLPKVTRRWAGLGLIALLVVFLLTHVHMALNPADYADLGVPAWGWWARLPVQGVLVAWVWWTTQPRR
ncbi:MAG: MauE/DoxX family redox-associated membrane protein [Bacteroidota bacterium]